MITVVLMILEAKFNKDFGDATRFTPFADLVGASMTAVACMC